MNLSQWESQHLAATRLLCDSSTVDAGAQQLADLLVATEIASRESISAVHTVRVLGMLAFAYGETGDTSRAVDVYRRLLAVVEEEMRFYSETAFSTLLSRASLEAEEGSVDQVERTVRRALHSYGSGVSNFGEAARILDWLHERRNEEHRPVEDPSA